MILYQHCCLSALCISLVALSLSGPFFTTSTLILLPSLPLAPFPLFLSCPPNPLLLQRSLASTLPFPPLQLSVVDLVRGRVGSKEKACLKQQFFSISFFLLSSYLELPSGVPHVNFLPAAETKPSCFRLRLSWEAF